MHNFIWRALLTAVIWYYSIPGTLTKHIFTLREKTRNSQSRAYPFHQSAQFSQAFLGHQHPPQVLCFLKEKIKRKRACMISVISFPRSLLLLFFLSMTSLHVWQGQNWWSPEDAWRRTVQISAAVGYNSRTLQGTLVELPVQTSLVQTASEYANIDFTPQPIQANQVLFVFFFFFFSIPEVNSSQLCWESFSKQDCK